MNKALLGVLLLVTLDIANAGQTIKKFDRYQSSSISGRATSLYWVDKDKQPIDDFEYLGVEQGIRKQFYLADYSQEHLSDPAHYAKSYLELKVVDAASDPKGDILVEGSRGSGARCKFEYSKISTTVNGQPSDYQGLFCPAALTATKAARPNAVERFAQYATAPGEPSAIVIDMNMEGIHVSPYQESGSIQVVAVDGVPNKISALSVSRNAADDSIPIHLEVVGATDMKAAHLKFKPVDSRIAKISKDSCDFIITDGMGHCEAILTPQQVGQTTIDFAGSRYTRTNGDVMSYERLPRAVVNIGSLYAGYMNGEVRRKGDKPQTLDANFPVRSLAMNAKHNILYAINGFGVYAQKDPQPGLSLVKKATIGSQENRLQVMSLSNDANEVLVGNAYGKFYKVTDATYEELTVANGMGSFTPINSSYIDQTNNRAYIIDANNNLGVYKGGRLNKIDLRVNNQHEGLVAANSGVVYVALNPYTRGGEATLYKFVDDKLEEVKINPANNPFRSSRIRNLFFADMDELRVQLYAVSEKGEIYRLNHMAIPNKWELYANLSSGDVITDVAVDNVKNIYLASGQKVWRIKYDDKKVTELSEYATSSSRVVSVVVDPNESGKWGPIAPTGITVSDEGDCIRVGKQYWSKSANIYAPQSTNGGAAGTVNYRSAVKKVEALNRSNFCRRSTWRIPTVDDFDKLILSADRYVKGPTQSATLVQADPRDSLATVGFRDFVWYQYITSTLLAYGQFAPRPYDYYVACKSNSGCSAVVRFDQFIMSQWPSDIAKFKQEEHDQDWSLSSEQPYLWVVSD